MDNEGSTAIWFWWVLLGFCALLGGIVPIWLVSVMWDGGSRYNSWYPLSQFAADPEKGKVESFPDNWYLSRHLQILLYITQVPATSYGCTKLPPTQNNFLSLIKTVEDSLQPPRIFSDRNYTFTLTFGLCKLLAATIVECADLWWFLWKVPKH